MASSIVELERQHSWHFLVDMGAYNEDPCVLQSGSGSWLEDVEGNRLLDGNASMWTSTFGHRDPDLDRVLKDQIDTLAHTTKVGRGHTPSVLLASKLAGLTGGELGRAFFTNNGSTAIEAALKMSFYYWKTLGKPHKTKVLSLIEGHHGLSFGAMSLSSIHKDKTPNTLNTNHFETIEELENLIVNDVACVVMESGVQAIRGRGMYILPEGFLREVSEICKSKNVHLILDEVFTGFFRTGTMFACEQEGVWPDFLCLGKSISAGYLPMGVTMAREAIFEAIYSQPGFYHGHTYGGNPLACRVALENIRKLEEGWKSGFLGQQMEVFQGLFDSHFTECQGFTDPRKKGMIAAISLEEGTGDRVCKRARELGVLIRSYKDSIYFVPPLNVTEDEINLLFNTIKKCITY